MLNYISFVISGCFWSLFTKENYDQVFVYQLSPVFQAIPGICYANRKKINISMYILDIWPESFFAVTGRENKYLKKYLTSLSKRIYKKMNKIYISSPGFEKSIISKGISPHKIEFLPQFCEDVYLSGLPVNFEENFELDKRKINITFAGNIGKAQGLEILIGAAIELKKTNSSIIFNLIGNGSYKEELIKNVEQLELTNYFKFIPSVPVQEVKAYMENSDFALVSIMDDEFINLTIPGKVQSIMAMGIPLIISGGYILKEIIKSSQSGLWSYSGNLEQLLVNLRIAEGFDEKTKKKFGNNAKSYYLNNYDKAVVMDSLKKGLEK